jgi:hypothetical protein
MGGWGKCCLVKDTVMELVSYRWDKPI